MYNKEKTAINAFHSPKQIRFSKIVVSSKPSRSIVSQHMRKKEMAAKDLDCGPWEDGTLNESLTPYQCFEGSTECVKFSLGAAVQNLEGNSICARCEEPFTPEEKIISCKEQLFHDSCFVCSQCFRPLELSEFYEHKGRRYCRYDFQILIAPLCSRCGQFIMSRGIKAMHQSWHPECLTCEFCGLPLVAAGLQKFQNKPLCPNCFAKAIDLTSDKPKCQTCRSSISPEEQFRFKGQCYHAYHFHCHQCGKELGPDAVERGEEVYCFSCFIQLGIPICAACRRPIEDRIVWALGKSWHVEHFVCRQCEIPFMGGRFYEWQGYAYCLMHYQARTGRICHVCARPVTGLLASFTNKTYCPQHFVCSLCDRQLTEKSKLYEIDLKPACKECYERLPTRWKRQLAKWHLAETPKQS